MWRLLCFVPVLALAGTATAGMLDLPNEIVNGDFEAGSWTPWTNLYCGLLAQGVNQLPVNPAGGGKWAGATLYWSGNYNAPIASMQQVVDGSQFSGWDPSGTRKNVDIEFDYLLGAIGGNPANQAGLKVYLGWQGDGSEPPNPASQRQLVFEAWQAPGAQTPPWAHADISVELPAQPKFLSVEFEIHARFANTTVVGVDNVCLEGQCVPEPASLLLLMLAGLPLLRRR